MKSRSLLLDGYTQRYAVERYTKLPLEVSTKQAKMNGS